MAIDLPPPPGWRCGRCSAPVPGTIRAPRGYCPECGLDYRLAVYGHPTPAERDPGQERGYVPDWARPLAPATIAAPAASQELDPQAVAFAALWGCSL